MSICRIVQQPMSVIVGLDPGNKESALVLLDGKTICGHIKTDNDAMLELLKGYGFQRDWMLVIEQVASFGMPVGEEVFETVFWSGRFAQVWGRDFSRLRRIDVKNRLCKNSRANDAHIRQALIDRFGPSKEIAIGSKAKPGPLHQIHSDEWSALAVALAWQDDPSDHRVK